MTELGVYFLFLSSDAATVLLLCWVRIWVFFKIVPFFAGETLPAMVRNILAASLSIAIFPLVNSTLSDDIDPNFFWFVSVVAKEVFLGLLIGYTVALLFWAIGGVGFVIDNQRGASMASAMNPLLGDQSSPLGTFLSQVLVTLYFVGGGFMATIDGLYASYILWPPVSYFPVFKIDNAVFFLNQLDDYMYLIFLLGAPLVACMFLAEFGLALVGRFAPQLNVFFLAMPIKSGIAIFVLIIYLPILVPQLVEEYFSIRVISELLDTVLK